MNIYLIGMFLVSSYMSIFQGNWIPLRDGMDMLSYKAVCLPQQDKVIGLFLCLFAP